jgi:sugar lactone lactonase YvrE
VPRPRRVTALLSLAGVVVAAAIVATLLAVSAGPNYTRPPLLCAANGMAVHGSDLWVSGCVFKDRSAFSTRVPAIVELNASNGSLLRIFKDRDSGNDGPDGLTISDSRVWVANGDGNSVVELNAMSGSLVRVIKAKADRFNSPWTITADATHVWVFNAGNFTITELNASNGSLVRVIRARADDLAFVSSMSIVDGHLWLTNGTTQCNCIVELSAASGALVKVIHDNGGDLNGPSSMTIRGSTLWVTSDEGPVTTKPLADGDTNLPGGSVTELNAKRGSLIRVINAKKDGFNGSHGIAVTKSHVWVANPYGETVTELKAPGGTLLRVMGAKADHFGGPGDIIVRGSRVWVLDSAVLLSTQADVWGGAVTELNASNGVLVRVIR